MPSLHSISHLQQMPSCSLQNSPCNIRNFTVIQRSIWVDQSKSSFLLATTEGKFSTAAPSLPEVFVLPIKIRLHVIFNELTDYWISTKLAHQDGNAQPFHISQPCIHEFEGLAGRLEGRTFEMVAKDRLILIFVAAWSVNEASIECEIEGDRFKANISIWIFLSDRCDHIIVKLLELEPFSYARQQQERISDGIPHKGLVYQLIRNHIGISSESFSDLLPILHELLMEITARVIEMVEYIPYVVAKVIFSPILLITVVPVRHP